MKYTILGFSQKVAVSFGLTAKDLLILRWFVDYSSSGKMVRKRIDEVDYYWVDYSGIIEELPILYTTKKDTIYRSLTNMSKLGILEHKTIKQGGVWSYYKIGVNYINLISDTSFGDKSEPFGLKSEHIGNKSEPLGLKSQTKNPSTIKDNNIYSRVVGKLNCLTGKDYKSTTNKTKSLIQARINEGFKEENFYKVIEIKVNQWKGTEYEKYLRPDTLFSNKFEGYLNEVSTKIKDSVKKDNGFYPNIKFEEY